MSTEFSQKVHDEALKRLEEESFEQAVVEEKLRLKSQSRHWFPWRVKIIIERRS
jgi:hypothetical protein